MQLLKGSPCHKYMDKEIIDILISTYDFIEFFRLHIQGIKLLTQYALVGLDVTKERGRSGGSLGVWGAARTEKSPHFHSSVLTLHSSSGVVILQYGACGRICIAILLTTAHQISSPL